MCICSPIYIVDMSLLQYVAKSQAREYSTTAWWEELGCEIVIHRGISVYLVSGEFKQYNIYHGISWSSKMPNYGVASLEQLPAGVGT